MSPKQYAKTPKEMSKTSRQEAKTNGVEVSSVCFSYHVKIIWRKIS
jgi:hypothetical protein